MVDIDPLGLVKSTPLRCFGEEAQDQLVKYLQIFLPDRSKVNMRVRPEGRKSARGPGRARARRHAHTYTCAHDPL